MRRIKEGYTLSYCYKNDAGIAYHHSTSKKYKIQECINNEMKKDYDGDPIIDYQFFTPNGYRCILEEATEKKELVIQEGTYWKDGDGKVVMIVLNKSKLPGFDPTHRPRYLGVFEDGNAFSCEPKDLENSKQVANWEGDPL